VTTVKLASFYAFFYASAPPPSLLSPSDGWQVYDLAREFARMGVGGSNQRSAAWRFTTVNNDYEVCRPKLPSSSGVNRLLIRSPFSSVPRTQLPSLCPPESATQPYGTEKTIEAKLVSQRLSTCIGPTTYVAFLLSHRSPTLKRKL
jgi:hypothetical protein